RAARKRETAMNLTTPSGRLGEALARSTKLWEAQLKAQTMPRGPAEPPPAFTVAISREAGTDAGKVAAQLGERLGWPVYDRELLPKTAEEAGLRGGVLESVDEKRAGWVQALFQGFSARPPPAEDAYVCHLSRVLLALAAHGQCVLVGRGAA